MIRLKELRNEIGVTQQEISIKTQISRSILSQYENGIVEPTATVISKLADFFHVTTDYLLGRCDETGEVIIQSENSFATSPLEQRLILDFRKLHPDLQSLLLETVAIWQKQNASSEAAKKKA